MIKNRRRWYSALALWAICATLPACQKLQEPVYIDVENLAFNAGGRSQTTLSADVRFYNPNKRNIDFRSGSLDIFVENKLLGHTELDSLIHISRLDTFQIPIRINLDLKQLVNNALTLAFKDSVQLRLEGKIKVGRSGVYITKPVKYETKEKLDLMNGLW